MNDKQLDVDDLQDIIWSFASSRVITAANQTGILRRLAGQPGTVPQVASELELDPLATGKVMRALTALGLLVSSGEDYRVGPGLAPYLNGGDDDMGPFLDHHQMMYQRWGENLEGWLRGEEWTTKPREKPDIARFGAAMRAMGARVAAQLAGALELAGARTMLDVGGGFGHYARALCEAHPQLSATVLDTPEVAELGREAMAEAGLAQRVDYRAGDYLGQDTDFGQGYDLVLQANILHQERPERAALLVQRGAQALAPGGRLVVLDFTIDEQQQTDLMGALFAVNMRSFGDTYTESTIRGWMEQSGLTRVQRQDFARHRWLITGHR